jgi:hypothetical protein
MTSLVVMACSYKYGTTSSSTRTGVIVGILGFIFAWDISWAPLMWVVVSEVLPSEVRPVLS